MNLDKFIQRNGLPDDVSDSAERCYLPFAEWLDERLRTLQQDETVKVPRFDKARSFGCAD